MGSACRSRAIVAVPLQWNSSAARGPRRGQAFYGDEDDLVPPSGLFDRTEAEEAIAAVEAGVIRGLFEIA